MTPSPVFPLKPQDLWKLPPMARALSHANPRKRTPHRARMHSQESTAPVFDLFRRPVLPRPGRIFRQQIIYHMLGSMSWRELRGHRALPHVCNLCSCGPPGQGGRCATGDRIMKIKLCHVRTIYTPQAIVFRLRSRLSPAVVQT